MICVRKIAFPLVWRRLNGGRLYGRRNRIQQDVGDVGANNLELELGQDLLGQAPVLMRSEALAPRFEHGHRLVHLEAHQHRHHRCRTEITAHRDRAFGLSRRSGHACPVRTIDDRRRDQATAGAFVRGLGSRGSPREPRRR